MVKYLASGAACKLNYFPNKNTISKHYSPWTKLYQENIDYEKHCKFTFGKYVQAHNEANPTNTSAPRFMILFTGTQQPICKMATYYFIYQQIKSLSDNKPNWRNDKDSSNEYGNDHSKNQSNSELKSIGIEGNKDTETHSQRSRRPNPRYVYFQARKKTMLDDTSLKHPRSLQW